jgi:hypothetical protein
VSQGIYHWLALACRSIRETTDTKLTQVAARADKDQSAIYRFESGSSYPRDIENVVTAYAEACGLNQPHLLWADALRLWGQAEGVEGDLHAAAMGRESQADVLDLVQGNAERLKELEYLLLRRDQFYTKIASFLDRLDGIEQRLDLIESNGHYRRVTDAREFLSRAVTGDAGSVLEITADERDGRKPDSGERRRESD